MMLFTGSILVRPYTFDNKYFDFIRDNIILPSVSRLAFPWDCLSLPLLPDCIPEYSHHLCYTALTKFCVFMIMSDLFIDLHCNCHSLSLLHKRSFFFYTGFSFLVAHFSLPKTYFIQFYYTTLYITMREFGVNNVMQGMNGK